MDAIDTSLNSMYQLGYKHGSTNALTVENVSQWLESLTTDEESFRKLKLALEEVTVESEDVGYDDSDRSDELREYRDNQ